MSEPNFSAETPLGKFFLGGVSGANLHLIFSFFSFALTCVIAWGIWTHTVDAKESARDMATVLKESNREIAVALKASNADLAVALRDLTQASREQTCILSLPQRDRSVEVCKRIVR